MRQVWPVFWCGTNKTAPLGASVTHAKGFPWQITHGAGQSALQATLGALFAILVWGPINWLPDAAMAGPSNLGGQMLRWLRGGNSRPCMLRSAKGREITGLDAAMAGSLKGLPRCLNGWGFQIEGPDAAMAGEGNFPPQMLRCVTKLNRGSGTEKADLVVIHNEVRRSRLV